MKTYGLLGTGKGHLITHLELGTLFFVASLTEYGKKGARIGFVLPRSIFTADQHENFRKASFGKAIHGTGLTEVWDAENVSPLFNVPACVVFGKNRHFTEKPISAEVLGGMLDRRNASLEESKKYLTTRETKLHVIKQGERSFWSENAEAEISIRSPYASKFKNGATMYPRAFWFVEVQKDPDLGFNPIQPLVASDHRALDEAKENYRGVRIEGIVESEFLHATLLSTDILPFGFTQYRMVAVPLKVSGSAYAFYDQSQLRKYGYIHMAEWVEKCQRIWEKRRREKANRLTVLEWLDYRRKISLQQKFRYRVLYPVSATYLCSNVVEIEKIEVKIGDQKLRLSSFIADYKCFYFDTESENEAYYISSVLNSKMIDTLIKPMQSRGLWGPRDICKKVWELPIPTYNESKSAHNELAKLGIECTEKVTKFLSTLDTKEITPGKIGRLRRDVREKLSDELKEIDGIVRKIMVK